MSGHTRSPLAVLTYITKQSAQKTWRRGRRDKKVMEMQETSHTFTPSSPPPNQVLKLINLWSIFQF